eukprot:g76064.t1
MQNSHSRGSPRAVSDSEQVYMVFAENDSDGQLAQCILRHNRCTRVLKSLTIPKLQTVQSFSQDYATSPDCVPIKYKNTSERTGSEQPMKDALTEIEARLTENEQYTTVCYPADKLTNLYAQRVDIPSEDTRKFPRRLHALARRINAERGHGR